MGGYAARYGYGSGMYMSGKLSTMLSCRAIQAAQSLGMRRATILQRIELPLAAPVAWTAL